MERLHPSTTVETAGRHRAAALRPREAARGIVHLGIGAFAARISPSRPRRASTRRELRWGIVGVSLRQPTRAMRWRRKTACTRVALRDADADGCPRQSLRVIGAPDQVLVGAGRPGAVLARIAHADTRIVSLTVTEKGYSPRPGERRAAARRSRHPARPRARCSTAHRDRLPVRGLHLRMQRERAAASRCCRSTTCRPMARTCARWCSSSPSIRCRAAPWILSRCTLPELGGRSHRAAHVRRRSRPHRAAAGPA